MVTIWICIVLLFLGFSGLALYLTIVNSDLKNRLETTESQLRSQVDNIALLIQRTAPKAPTQEQKEFRESVELKWKTVVEDLMKDLKNQIKHDSSALSKQIEKYKDDFDEKVRKAYEKACDSIAFHTVEYKKTITKKRKEHSRKNKATKSQQEHRTIDDE